MKKHNYSIPYIIASFVALFLFYKTFTDFLVFPYDPLWIPLIVYSSLLICCILIAVGKLRSNRFINIGVFVFIAMSIIPLLTSLPCPPSIAGLCGEHSLESNLLIPLLFLVYESYLNYILFIISTILIIVGIFKGRTKVGDVG